MQRGAQEVRKIQTIQLDYELVDKGSILNQIWICNLYRIYLGVLNIENTKIILI